MKRLAAIIITISALLTAACVQQTATAHIGQKIVIDGKALVVGASDTLKFGTLHSGETVVKHIAFSNETEEPFVVIRYETSCHCTSFKYDRRPVMPGSEADIECTFDSSGASGWQMKLVNFYLSGAESPIKIYIEADVK